MWLKSIIKKLKKWGEEYDKAMAENAKFMAEHPEMFIEWNRLI